MIATSKITHLPLSPSGEITLTQQPLSAETPPRSIPWSPLPEHDELILLTPPAPSDQSSAPTEEPAPASYFRALVPKTLWGKLLGLTALGVTGVLSTLGMIKLLEDTGVTEGVWLTRTLGAETSWSLYQKLGFHNSVEVIQAYGLDVPKVLVKHLGVKDTVRLAYQLGFQKSLEAIFR